MAINFTLTIHNIVHYTLYINTIKGSLEQKPSCLLDILTLILFITRLSKMVITHSYIVQRSSQNNTKIM